MDIIRVEQLCKKYGDFTAVDHVSFAVEQGEIFAFLGPNGAGKTTTIKMLTTLLQPSSGSLTVNGFDPRLNQAAVRRAFGIVFQDPSLDDELTAQENMEFHAVLYGVPVASRLPRIRELLTFVELWDRRRDLVKHFSGGMKRRLEIARGLLHEPKVFFLDEPTLGLDPQTRNHVWGHLQRLNREKGITVFFTTHYMEEAERVSSRIAIIDHGKIIAHGTAQALKEKTNTPSLEAAFLALTGHELRAEEAQGADQMRLHRRLWARR